MGMYYKITLSNKIQQIRHRFVSPSMSTLAHEPPPSSVHKHCNQDEHRTDRPTDQPSSSVLARIIFSIYPEGYSFNHHKVSIIISIKKGTAQHGGDLTERGGGKVTGAMANVRPINRTFE